MKGQLSNITSQCFPDQGVIELRIANENPCIILADDIPLPAEGNPMIVQCPTLRHDFLSHFENVFYLPLVVEESKL
jgi:hypothetical protein